MINEYEIDRLYKMAFGYRGTAFGPGEQEPEIELKNKIVTEAESTLFGLNGKTLKGIPLYMPTGFLMGGVPVQLPNEPILTFSTRKTIVETPLAGNTRRGTVKELINSEDWSIRIQGVCIDENRNGYPQLEVLAIKKLFDYNGNLQILNYICQVLLEIRKVVIKDLTFSGIQGHPYSQAYEMSLVSDEDFMLIKV